LSYAIFASLAHAIPRTGWSPTQLEFERDESSVLSHRPRRGSRQLSGNLLVAQIDGIHIGDDLVLVEAIGVNGGGRIRSVTPT
jgi:hypothetical protein